MTTPKNPWTDLHRKYQLQDWLDKPSLFAAQVVDFFPPQSRLLELGAGLGQDGRFFAEYGMQVMATDLEPTLLEIDQRKRTADIRERLEFKQMDLRQPFPFEDASFDVVYAHLSLHYFDRETTGQVFAEINRCLNHKAGWPFWLIPRVTLSTTLARGLSQISL